jgi:NADPH2:quinone reductase
MRAVVLTAPSGAAALTFAEIPAPQAGPGELLVKVAYGGMNFADLMMLLGTYPHPRGYPIVAGLEIAGAIAAIGPGVTGWRIGERVAAFSEQAGGFAECCVVPCERAIRIPDEVGLQTAASFPIQALTAWNMLHGVGRTAPGDVILIHAIGGGVGLAATQLAVRAGAVVLGTVGTVGKETRALGFGAARVFNRAEEDFVAGVLAFTGGRGVDKVLDSVGATVLDRSFEAIRMRGHVVSIGEAEGRPLPNLWERLVRRSLTFTRFHLGHSDFQSETWAHGVADALGGLCDGWLALPVAQVFAFDDAPAMYARLGSRTVSGKLLLAVSPG